MTCQMLYWGQIWKRKVIRAKKLREEGWARLELSFDQVKYAALDARLSFEIPRKNGQSRDTILLEIFTMYDSYCYQSYN